MILNLPTGPVKPNEGASDVLRRRLRARRKRNTPIPTETTAIADRTATVAMIDGLSCRVAVVSLAAVKLVDVGKSDVEEVEMTKTEGVGISEAVDALKCVLVPESVFSVINHEQMHGTS